MGLLFRKNCLFFFSNVQPLSMCVSVNFLVFINDFFEQNSTSFIFPFLWLPES